MKIKYLIGAVIGLSAAYVLYAFIKETFKEKKSTLHNVEKDACTDSESYVSGSQDVNIENKCEITEKQVCSNIERRNAMAVQVLSDIHEDMVKSVDNIEEKKASIEKLMNSLKN